MGVAKERYRNLLQIYAAELLEMMEENAELKSINAALEDAIAKQDKELDQLRPKAKKGD